MHSCDIHVRIECFVSSKWALVTKYGTDLMQRRTRTRVVGYHLPCTRTTSSVSFNGLELGLALGLERKLERAFLQTENISKGA